ncbi:hypothetical protein [uncultured Shimia sp.]|uniref:hypothetical protein n=1 Tax=uncultured Shimia sp. TaxID=573152 RepID=UPI00260CDB72|nr:hypothetical protein [uncultured Shimia sp.]
MLKQEGRIVSSKRCKGMRLAYPVLAATLSSPLVAQAEGYSTSDLGVLYDKAECMDRAVSVLERYKDTLGANSVSAGSWNVFAWDLEPGDQDVVILCAGSTTNDNEYRRALLVVHGEASETERLATRDVIKGYWNAY